MNVPEKLAAIRKSVDYLDAVGADTVSGRQRKYMLALLRRYREALKSNRDNCTPGGCTSVASAALVYDPEEADR